MKKQPVIYYKSGVYPGFLSISIESLISSSSSSIKCQIIKDYISKEQHISTIGKSNSPRTFFCQYIVSNQHVQGSQALWLHGLCTSVSRMCGTWYLFFTVLFWGLCRICISFSYLSQTKYDSAKQNGTQSIFTIITGENFVYRTFNTY